MGKAFFIFILLLSLGLSSCMTAPGEKKALKFIDIEEVRKEEEEKKRDTLNVNFSQSSIYKSEGDGFIQIEINFDKQAIRAFKITLTASGGNAVDNIDYQLLDENIFVNRGAKKAFARFKILNNNKIDGLKNVELTLDVNDKKITVNKNKVIINIEDDELPSSPKEQRFQKAYTLIKSKCVNCHTSSIHDIFKTLDTSQKWVQGKKYISSGFSESSLLLKRLKNYGSNMPIGAPSISNLELGYLKDWINNLEKNKKVTIGFSKSSIYKRESDKEFSFDINFDNTVSEAFSIIILRVSGDAVNNEDYRLISNIIPVKAGDTKAVVKFKTLEDNKTDGTKKVEFTLSVANDNIIIGSNNKVLISISDDDVNLDPEQLRFQKAYTIIKNKCSSCHTSNIHSIFKSLNSSDKWVLDGSYIIPGKALNSPLLKRLKNYGSDMPIAANALLDSEVNELKSWINNLKALSKPQINFSKSLTEKAETVGNVNIKVTLSSPLSVATSVKIKTQGTLALNEDYTLSNNTITFSPGETSKSFSFSIVNDSQKESTENLVLSIVLLDSKIVLGLTKKATLNILDDDNIDGITLNNSSIVAHAPDRIYISSFLRYVFGPSSESYIDKYINNNHYVFGSKCDIYEHSLGNANTGKSDLIWDDKFEFKEVAPCTEDSYGGSIKTRSYELSSVLREAWRTNFCENTMHDNQAAVTYALSNKSLTKSSVVNLQNTGLLFDLFYPGKVMPDQLGNALVDLAQTNSSKKWETILLTLCLSPEWQTP